MNFIVSTCFGVIFMHGTSKHMEVRSAFDETEKAQNCHIS